MRVLQKHAKYRIQPTLLKISALSRLMDKSKIRNSPAELATQLCVVEEDAEISTPISGCFPLEDQVMSEVHIGCPPLYSAPQISHFTFTIPFGVDHESRTYIDNFEGKSGLVENLMDMDEDGDLIVARKSKMLGATGGVTIQHKVVSTIAGVGCQVWRAELVLADFVLHKMFVSMDLNDVTAVELGAGTGLVGILLARVLDTVYITDRSADILDNCAKNVELNSGAFKSHSSIRVRELDWLGLWPPSSDINSGSPNEYSWTPSEVKDVNRASLLLAADVIYSDDLTDAFFRILENLMSCGPEKVLYLALEKRYNFSLNDLDVVANGYSHFRSYLRNEESEGIEDYPLPKFVGKRINVSTIPQYMRGYDRGYDVELWMITYDNRKT
ncbi:hypothetical protein V2J09_011123 [Rumex salicifolius]